jgi:translation initiation factor IF-2
VSNERASECLDAFRSPPSRSVILQRVAYECGLALEKFNEIQEGDIIEAYKMEAIKRELT